MVPRKFYCETVNAKNEPVSNFMSNESSTVVKQTNGFCGNAEETEQCFFQRFDFAEIDNQEIECQNICKRNKLNVCAPMVTKMIDGMLSSVDYEKKTETEVFYTNPDMVCTPPPHCLANVSFGKVSHSLSPKITRKRKTLYSSIVDSFNSNGFLYKSPCDEHFCELDYSNENKTVQPTIFFEESPLNLKFKTPVFRENGVTRSSSTTQVSHTTIINGTPQAPQRRHRGNLLYSILDGNTEQVNMALKNGEDPNASLNIPEWVMGEPCRLVPILLASKLAFPTIVQLLLKYGAVLNSVNFQGQNALHLLFSPHRSVREFHQCNNDQKNETAEPVRSISIQKSWEDLESYFQSLPSLDHETYDADSTESMVVNESSFMLNFDLPDLKKCFLPKVQRSEETILDDICRCTDILLTHGIHKTRKDILGNTPWNVASQNPLISNHKSLLEKLRNSQQPCYPKEKKESKPSSLYTSLIPIHSNPLVPIPQTPSCCI